MGVAKTFTKVKRGNRQYVGGDPRQIVRGLLLSESQDMPIFQAITNSTVPMLNSFDARCLSNIIYSYGLIWHNPQIAWRRDCVRCLWTSSREKKLNAFNAQELANMLLAFMYVDAKNSRLFQETGDHIVARSLRRSSILHGRLLQLKSRILAVQEDWRSRRWTRQLGFIQFTGSVQYCLGVCNC